MTHLKTQRVRAQIAKAEMSTGQYESVSLLYHADHTFRSGVLQLIIQCRWWLLIDRTDGQIGGRIGVEVAVIFVWILSFNAVDPREQK